MCLELGVFWRQIKGDGIDESPPPSQISQSVRCQTRPLGSPGCQLRMNESVSFATSALLLAPSGAMRGTATRSSERLLPFRCYVRSIAMVACSLHHSSRTAPVQCIRQYERHSSRRETIRIMLIAVRRWSSPYKDFCRLFQ